MTRAKSPSFHMVLDLETVADPELPPKDEKKFPAPVHHKIACAGYAFVEDGYVVDWGVVTDPEPEILKRIATALDTSDPCVVGMNSRGFDMPVIAARCMRHGVPLPWYYRTKLPRYRYSDEKHLDLIDYLSDHGAATKSGLNVWSKAIGLPGKGDTDGSQVQALHDAGELEAIADYCMTDVAQTCAILLRASYVRGLYTFDEYGDRAYDFLRKCERDARTAALAAGANRARFIQCREHYIEPVAAE